ncbi:pentatricopeptide repeat (PPR) superfamily protein [Wolffia australiana]
MASSHAHRLLRYRDAVRRGREWPFFCVLPGLLTSCVELALPACAAAHLHARAVRTGWLAHPFVLTSLVSAYARLSRPALSRRLLRPAPPLPAAHNALVSALARAGRPRAAAAAFRHMLRRGVRFNSVTLLGLLPCCPPLPFPFFSSLHACAVKSAAAVANCLISVYSRYGSVPAARRVFDLSPPSSSRLQTVVRWNAMVTAYAQNGMAWEALETYREMARAGVRPDAVTVVAAVSCCAALGARALGRDLERLALTCGAMRENTFVVNALISMNARCGDLARAQELFDGMRHRTVVSWTALIVGYGAHGLGRRATELFDRMAAAGVRPDGAAMVAVLTACSHAGLADKGLRYFRAMGATYGVTPGPEHYTCVVDLLGRAGRLGEAWRLIGSMPVRPDAAVWGALLGACKIHRDVATAELAFGHVAALEPWNVGYYVLMANIYAEAGALGGAARVRAMARGQGLRKDPGMSHVEILGRVHGFVADDVSHPRNSEILGTLEELEALAGGAAGGSRHSERLAVAFALLETEPEDKVVVIKNLRVCDDCHVFLQRVSAAAGREIVVRDATRFHHFAAGECSCNGFW